MSVSSESPQTFASLGLSAEVLGAIAALGYEEPTPIQRQAIPPILQGRDLLGQAATGTGKTAAFSLPLAHAIGANAAPIPHGLILVPTRELAVQVSEAMIRYGRDARIKVVPIFGGQPIRRQLDMLDRGVHVVVATPGRAIDHIQRGSLQLDTIQTLVLDEADEMLDMGFAEDLETIIAATPDDRQTVLFSATMAKPIVTIAKRFMHDPVRIEIGAGEVSASQGSIRQSAYLVDRRHKPSALARILDVEVPGATIVFCRTRGEVDELVVTMASRGYRAEALHGGMDQRQRDRVMARLRDGTAELLVATDVAARGLDVDSLTHVVNYDVPSAPASYVHRIGRVGRAGRDGIAITLVEPRQRRLLDNIERLTGESVPLKKVPSVAALRARQIQITIEALGEALISDDLATYEEILAPFLPRQANDAADSGDPEGPVLAADDDAIHDDTVDNLGPGGDTGGDTGEADAVYESLEPIDQVLSARQVALAAIKLVHEARGMALDEREIPEPRSAKGNKGAKGGHRESSDRGPRPRRDDSDTGYVYVNLGGRVGVRPGDLVGAIANETGLSGRDIGPIRIADHYAVVGVPETSVDEVIDAIKSTTVRGKRAFARRFEDEPRSGPSKRHKPKRSSNHKPKRRDRDKPRSKAKSKGKPKRK